MADTMQERVAKALAAVVNPRVSQDVIAAGMIRDVATTLDGKVRFTILLAAQDPASLVREVRQAVERVDGVTEVRVDVKDPSQAKASAPNAMPGRPATSRALPVMNEAPQSKQSAVSAPTPVTYPNLGRVLAISSGKGGVGKSTVAVNLAISLARTGARVGLMDADIYGPNIPMMMGVNEPPPVKNEKIQPLTAHGVKLMSIGFLVERDQPAIWRGPIVMKVITQFLRDVEWGQLDYLLVDMPPGTGDAQLSLVQATHVNGAVIVTTPQEVSTGDALRGAKMFQRVGVPVLGIVENMSFFACPHCGEPTPIFGTGGGKRLADELGIPLLGEIPLYPQVLVGGDTGVPIVLAEPDSVASRALVVTAQRIGEAMGAMAAV
ncbi:MAG: Mrp/NBP35 family ATP-binding protein [Gemmatimonadota bacterium]|nr:Mrp/NBP35 family ATP-binding protein [Gemmatimonadota bacterium]